MSSNPDHCDLLYLSICLSNRETVQLVCLVKQQFLPVSSQTKPATGAKTGAGGCLAHNSLGSYLIRLIFCSIHKLSSTLDYDKCRDKKKYQQILSWSLSWCKNKDVTVLSFSEGAFWSASIFPTKSFYLQNCCPSISKSCLSSGELFKGSNFESKNFWWGKCQLTKRLPLKN